ncbi:hypothetical protein [Phytomonospora endophytica]|uniref:Uncharacterized protein n=1 Tax=Phytomonospora endophytica TaxID=714109 RepID=A0A841G2D2_9ACTN|nr:hypothetical protein [Phytomonospora endophytica]MBB6038300.1 hypothetical protein [Phytomonospora endophytica]GIG64230.1 hypothetical protein Pen01_05250 [Phytomonospora endophytica]
MATVMIRVDKSVRDAAAALATASGTTIAVVVAKAVKAAQRKAFWDSVDAAFARMSPEELADLRREQAAGDASLKDGLDEW